MVWGALKRGGAALATGGLSEAYRLHKENEASRDRPDYERLREQGDLASAFAGEAQGGYADRTQDMLGVRDHLLGQMRGENSLSAEQLRQGLQQNRAAQQSAAAGARPGNAAMAARTAAIQSGRLGAGLAGQQAMAGIAERNAAAQAAGGLLGGMRGQDLAGALGGRGHAIGAEGGVVGAQTQMYGQPTGTDRLLAGGMGLLPLAAASDERGKKNVYSDERGKEGAQPAGRSFLDALTGYEYEYKDPDAPGAAPGRHVGVMAQDLERAPLGRAAVADTPHGKMVDTSRLAHALAAGAADLNERVRRLEGGGR